MANKQQLNYTTNSPRTPKQTFQISKYTTLLSNDSLQSHSAPGSPVHPTSKVMLNSQSIGIALSPSSNSSSLLPLRMRTEDNDNQRPDLFNIRSNTEASDTEEHLITQSDTTECKNIQRKVSQKSFGAFSGRNGKRSKSAKRIFKQSNLMSRSTGHWAKENIPESAIVDFKDMGQSKKYRCSAEKVNRSVGGESIFHSEKKVLRSSLNDFDGDIRINGKLNVGEEDLEGLFDEGYVDKEGSCKETAYVRYSKMSEEDAATIFETRRKELLSFLMKLGSSSAISKISKKKLTYKQSGFPKQNIAPSQSPDMKKMELPSGQALRRLQDSLTRSISPTQFIIYNTASDNNANSQTSKFATPAKDKKIASLNQIGCESAPDGKRRNSAKFLREKEGLSPLIERNLEASFNQLFEWNDTGAKRSPIKIVKKAETTIKSNIDDKIDSIESITIDLTKASRLKKKKKSKKTRNDQENSSVSENVTVIKQLSEDMRTNSIWQQSEVLVENKIDQEAIVGLRKKNQAVLNQIDEIDSQIERMKETDNKGILSQRRCENEQSKEREEFKKSIYQESSQEGYSKMKKGSERSRSVSLKFGLKENTKNNESMQANSYKDGQKNKEHTGEVLESQSRRNQEVNKETVAASIDKETAEKTLVRVPSQKNTLKFDLTVKKDQSKDRQVLATKRALSNNTNVSKNELYDLNVTPITKGNSKNLKFKTFDIRKENVVVKQDPKPKTSITTQNRAIEKNKSPNELRVIQAKENSQTWQAAKSKNISKTHETNSTLQTLREHLATSPSPKELVFCLRKALPGNSKGEGPTKKREPSNPSLSSKSLISFKNSSVQPLSSKNNHRSVSDKDYSIESVQIPSLFESHSSSSIHESTTSASKTCSSKETTRFSKEEPKVERFGAPTSKKQLSKSKEPVKSIMQIKKKGDANRPAFDSNSSVNIRAKLFKRQNQENCSSSSLKPSLSPTNFSDSNKSSTKQMGQEGLRASSPVGIGSNQPFAFKKSETDKNLLRKGSLSTPRGFKLLSSPTNQAGGLAMSLQDLKGRMIQLSCGETEEENESLDSFRLREQSLNLPLKPSKVGKQSESMKTQDSNKDSQGLKRKKAAGYSVC